MADWEDIFNQWSKPPGKTEQDKCENAEKAIRDAIAVNDRLKYRDIKVFPQGSYHNNTNVRKDSDVDIAVVCYDVFFTDYPDGTSDETFGNKSSDYSYTTYKNEVEEALVKHFGRTSVKQGNKAFDIKENSYHVEADVAPFFEHRRYHKSGSYLSGVELRPDNGIPDKVINWPDRHYKNGVSKNNDTGRRYKSLVRIIKSLSNHMAEENVSQAQNIMGFLIECLVWNVPNDHFGYDTLRSDVRRCLACLFNNTMKYDKCSEWGEVSELKYLFRGPQKWTREQAHNFIDAAWDYLGLE
jgi:hypothetical protein